MALAVHYGKLDLTDAELNMFRRVRNVVSYPHGTLIKKKREIAELAFVFSRSRLIIASA